MSDLNAKYGTDWADLTITLADLASDTNLLTGRQSTVISNVSDLFTDVKIGGKITTGTSPSAAKWIEPWIFAEWLDADTYPDGFGASDAARTITSAGVKNSGFFPAPIIPTDTTSSRSYPIAPFSIVSVVGFMPRKWGIFITHNTGVNLHTTAGNHQISYLGLRYAIT